MKRYQLAPRGVLDVETGETIPPEHPAWLDYEAWLAAGEVPDDMPPAEQPCIEVVIAEKLAEIDNFAATLRRKVTDRASPSEMASWTVKLQEARRFAEAKDPAVAPLLNIEAEARGVALSEIAERVLRNSMLFSQMEARIAGHCGKLKDAVKQLTDSEAVRQYDIVSGWPNMGPRIEGDSSEQPQ